MKTKLLIILLIELSLINFNIFGMQGYLSSIPTANPTGKFIEASITMNNLYAEAQTYGAVLSQNSTRIQTINSILFTKGYNPFQN